MIERFKLITHGGLMDSADVQKIHLYLSSRMKITDQNVKKILAGHTAILAKNIEWQDVNKLQKHFSKLGLKTAISLQANSECFMAGLKNHSTISSITSKPEEKAGIWLKFNSQQLKPLIFSAKVETKIQGDDDVTVYTINNHRYRWNPVVLLILGIYLSLKIEIYLLYTLSTFIHTNIMVSLISLIILFASIIYFPKIVQSPQIMTFRDSKNGKSIIIDECFCWSLRIKKYRVRDEIGNILGHIFRSRHKAYYEDLSFVRHFNHDSSISLSDSANDLIHKVSGEFINDSLLESLIDTYHRVSKRVFRHQPAKSNISRYEKHANPILNNDKQAIAAITSLPIPGIRINDYFVDENKKLMLVAFSWVALNKFLL